LRAGTEVEWYHRGGEEITTDGGTVPFETEKKKCGKEDLPPKKEGFRREGKEGSGFPSGSLVRRRECHDRRYQTRTGTSRHWGEERPIPEGGKKKYHSAPPHGGEALPMLSKKKRNEKEAVPNKGLLTQGKQKPCPLEQRKKNTVAKEKKNVPLPSKRNVEAGGRSVT